MKSVPLFIIIISCAQIALGQNWKPINANTKFNYEHGNANYATNTIWTNSVQSIGGDTIYNLNGIVKKNTACDSILSLGLSDQRDAYCDLCRAYKNQPQFLQKKIILTSDNYYHFTEPSSFVLDVEADIGTSWIFDTLNVVTAEIIRIDTVSIFGYIDSVKTISLSIGDSIQLTKQHGILLFPDFENPGIYYKLIGTENPDAGETVPGFWEMFDYEVGSIICEFWNGYDSENPFAEYTSKTTITSKQVFSDKFVYGINTIYKSHSTFPEETTVFTNQGSLTFQNLAEEAFNLFNQQLFQIDDSTYYFVRLSKGNGKYFKTVGEDNNPGFGVFFKSSGSSDTLIPNCSYLFSVWSYMEGKGKNIIYSECNSPCLLYDPINYTYNHESYSYLPDGLSNADYCLPHDVSINEITFSDFQLFPNPANKELTIVSNKNLSHNISIYNQTGQVVFQTINQNLNKKILDVSSLSTGIYFVSLNDNSTSSFHKLVIMR